jgi:hypothetical protein
MPGLIWLHVEGDCRGKLSPITILTTIFRFLKAVHRLVQASFFNFVFQIFENENGTQLSNCTQEDSLSDPATESLRIDGLVRGSLCLVAVRAKHLFGHLASP